MSLLGRAVTRWVGHRWWAIVLVTAGALGWRLVRWLCRHPGVAAVGVFTAGLWWLIAELGRWSLPVVFAPLFVLWGAAFWAPSWFDRWCETPVRSRWRKFWTFRRHWQPAMVTTGLAQTHSGLEVLPRLGRVRCTAVVDEVRARMVPGQTVKDWQAVADRLAQTFGARSCRAYVLPGRPRTVVLRLHRPGKLVHATARRTRPAPLPSGETDLAW